MSWQPIETAPKDGTEILVWGRHRQTLDKLSALVARYDHGWWTTIKPRQAVACTHWMTLPLSPKEQGCS